MLCNLSYAPASDGATSRVSPSATSSPSWRTRSTATIGKNDPGDLPYWKSAFPPDSITGTSASITIYFAPVNCTIRAACAVIPMGMANQQNLDVVKLEAQLFDAVAQQRHALFQAAVDQNAAVIALD